MEKLKKWGLVTVLVAVGVWALVVSLKYFLFLATVFGIGYVIGRYLK
jgi:hypothetical protein